MGRLIELVVIGCIACRVLAGRWPWQLWGQFRGAGGARPAVPAYDAAELARARALLGLGDNPTRRAILDAHRQLMLAVHPDRGGNDTLARDANAARDLLMAAGIDQT